MFTQVFDWQICTKPHTTHALPNEPHDVASSPDWQTFELSQHPLQVRALQVSGALVPQAGRKTRRAKAATYGSGLMGPASKPLPPVKASDEGPRMPRKYLWLLCISLGVLVGDQSSKLWMLGRLTSAFAGEGSALKVFFSAAPEPGYDKQHFRSTDVIVFSDDFFRLRYAENQGAAFGLFGGLPEKYRAPLFHLVSIGAAVLIAYFFRKLRGTSDERFAVVGLSLVLGGALGNYVDRLARGFVIDFIEVHWHEQAYWPAFNVADAAIVVGGLLLLIDTFVRKEQPS